MSPTPVALALKENISSMHARAFLNNMRCFHTGGPQRAVWVRLFHDGKKGSACKVPLSQTDPDINDLAEAAKNKFGIALGNVDLSDIKVYADDSFAQPCEPWMAVETFEAGKGGEHPFYVKAESLEGELRVFLLSLKFYVLSGSTLCL